MVQYVRNFWKDERLPDGWELVDCTMLPKKGDLKLPKNWRSTMKIVIPQKVILNIINGRLTTISESLPHEAQCGFRPFRGCIDAIFNVRLSLKKRQEHNLESWPIFVDFVKAFDRVPRGMLWKVLAKLGVPKKVVRLLEEIHSKVTVRISEGDEKTTINSTNGVRQGRILEPILFSFLNMCDQHVMG